MVNYKAMLENPETEATTLLTIAVRAFQDPKDEDDITVFRWDPETIVLELKSQFDANVPEINAAKIHALITALTTNFFFADANAFESIVNGICGEGDIIGRNPPEPEEMAWAVQQVQWLLGDSQAKVFNELVGLYVGQILSDHDIYDPPKILNFAQRAEKFSWPAQDSDMFRSLWQRQAEQITKISEYLNEHAGRMMQDLAQIPGMIKTPTAGEPQAA